MILRTFDPRLVNRLIGNGADLTEALAEPLHVCLIEDDSGAIFVWRGPGIYEVHVFFAVRGRAAIDLGRRMLANMRSRHEARLFWALVPIGSRHVQMFTRLMGWTSCGIKETRNGLNELFVTENEPCRQQ